MICKQCGQSHNRESSAFCFDCDKPYLEKLAEDVIKLNDDENKRATELAEHYAAIFSGCQMRLLHIYKAAYRNGLDDERGGFYSEMPEVDPDQTSFPCAGV